MLAACIALVAALKDGGFSSLIFFFYKISSSSFNPFYKISYKEENGMKRKEIFFIFYFLHFSRKRKRKEKKRVPF